MMTETDRKIANEFQHRLSAIVPVLDFCVFGSRARGDASDDSDSDVFIELKTLTPKSAPKEAVAMEGHSHAPVIEPSEMRLLSLPKYARECRPDAFRPVSDCLNCDLSDFHEMNQWQSLFSEITLNKGEKIYG